MNKNPRVAIVGATGAVGVELLSCLESRNFPLSSLKLLASKRSAGKQVAFRGEMLTVEELTENSFGDVDLALFAAGGDISRKFAPIAGEAGCVVVDNSSAFRQDADVPLVVPEINPEAAFNHPRNIIASSYQAVSGSGQHGITELENQVRAICDGHPVEISTYPRQIAFNVLPQIDKFDANGYTKEELKMLNEGRKIMGLPELKVTCTCVRVPVYRSHSISCVAQFEQPVDVEGARACFDGKPGVALMDDPEAGVWPTPLDSTNGDTCFVGRIRKDLAIDNALNLWVVGDQVRKGAALNAVQIAELLVKGN